MTCCLDAEKFLLLKEVFLKAAVTSSSVTEITSASRYTFHPVMNVFPLLKFRLRPNRRSLALVFTQTVA